MSPDASDRVLLAAVAGLAAGARWPSQGGRPLLALAALAGAAALAAGRHRMRRHLAPAVGAVSFMAMAPIGATLAERSLSGLVAPATGFVEGAQVTVLSDPTAGPFGTSAVIGWRGKRLSAREAIGVGVLGRCTVGDRLVADLRVADAVGPPKPWRLAAHLVGDAEITAIVSHRPARGMWGVAASIRTHMGRSFETIPRRLRPLAGGFVLGDDRGQSAEVAADFRASGLGHLLVVSGQNVAFVLAAAGPLIERLRLRWRVVGVFVILAVFGSVTRWEPSVLRAVAMAAAAAAARSAGRPQQALRVIGLGGGAVLLIDPLLVWSLGFCLSIAATLGLALFASPLEGRFRARRVPGWVAAPLAATIAAQVFTVWLILPLSGGIPAGSIPANLVAVPLAGPTMVLGIVLGGLGGFLRPAVADALLTPVELLLGAIAWVAETCAAVPLGQWSTLPLAVGTAAGASLAVTGVTGVVGPSVRSRIRAAAGIALGGAIVTAPLGAGWSRAETAVQLDGGGTIWRSGTQWFRARETVLVLRGRIDAEDLLGSLRARSIRVVDVVVVERPNRGSLAAVHALSARVHVRVVAGSTMVAADIGRGPKPIALRPSERIVVGRWTVSPPDDAGADARGGSGGRWTVRPVDPG